MSEETIINNDMPTNPEEESISNAKKKKIPKVKKKINPFTPAKIFSWLGNSLTSHEMTCLEIIQEVLNKTRLDVEYAINQVACLKIPWLKILLCLEKLAKENPISQPIAEFLQLPQTIEAIVLECISEDDIEEYEIILQHYGNATTQFNSKLDDSSIQGCQASLLWLTLHQLNYTPANQNDFWKMLIQKSCAEFLSYSSSIKQDSPNISKFCSEIRDQIVWDSKEIWDAFVQGKLYFFNTANQTFVPQNPLPNHIQFNLSQFQSYVQDMTWLWEKQWCNLLHEQAKKPWQEQQRNYLQIMSNTLSAFPYQENPILILSYYLTHLNEEKEK